MAADAHKTHDVIVLGGGICGLTCAWQLARARRDVVLLEKEAALGGVMRTEQHDGWLTERGPNSFTFCQNDDIHQLIQQLGLEEDLQSRPIRESDRYIWRAGALRRVPVSPLQMLRKNAISRRTMARAATGLWRSHGLPDYDISVGAFFSPILGRKAVDQVLGPVMAGIYAADPFSLSFEAVMPALHDAAMQSRTLAGAMKNLRKSKGNGSSGTGTRVLASFTGGMNTLASRIHDQACQAGANITTSCEISSVAKSDNSEWIVTDTAGKTYHARNIVSALPAGVASATLKDVAPEASVLLSRIRYMPMVVASIGVKESDVAITHPGFGYLAVRDAQSRALGMIWSDRMFNSRAPQGHRLFTVFLGGQIDTAICATSDDSILEAVKSDLRRIMQWSGEQPDMVNISRVSAAIPLMEVGHMGRVRLAQQALPGGLYITGNYVAGVSVPACMRSAINLAQSITQNDETRHN